MHSCVPKRVITNGIKCQILDFDEIFSIGRKKLGDCEKKFCSLIPLLLHGEKCHFLVLPNNDIFLQSNLCAFFGRVCIPTITFVSVWVCARVYLFGFRKKSEKATKILAVSKHNNKMCFPDSSQSCCCC